MLYFQESKYDNYLLKWMMRSLKCSEYLFSKDIDGTNFNENCNFHFGEQWVVPGKFICASVIWWWENN